MRLYHVSDANVTDYEPRSGWYVDDEGAIFGPFYDKVAAEYFMEDRFDEAGESYTEQGR